jgi:hypothetical protein
MPPRVGREAGRVGKRARGSGQAFADRFPGGVIDAPDRLCIGGGGHKSGMMSLDQRDFSVFFAV